MRTFGGPRIRVFTACLSLFVSVSGCAEEAAREMPTSGAAAPATPESNTAVAVAPGAAPAEQPGDAEKPPVAMPRKIIYNGYVDLVVDDLGSVEAKLTALVEGKRGYIADTNVTGSPGAQRSGSWKVRVPAEYFTEVMSRVARLGELRTSRTESQDVSQEYYDIEARIAVKKQEEKRLLKILEEAAGKLKDILDVEKELSRVRTETEQMEGRLRWLAHNTSLSTISITATEIKNYRPPVAPTFAERIARSFRGSIEALVTFLMNVTVALVAIVPWLVLIVPVMALVWIIRRRFRSARA
jgi:hypothetical protein